MAYMVNVDELASRANAHGQASAANLKSLDVKPPDVQLLSAVLGGFQMLTCAVYSLAIAVCERLDDQNDVPAPLLEKPEREN